MLRWLAALALVGAAATTSAAQSAPSARCSVYEVQGSKDGESIDPALKPIEKKLRDFGKWTSFKSLGKIAIEAQQRKKACANLSNGRKICVVFKDKVDGHRLRLSWEVEGKDGTQIFDSTVVTDSGDHMLLNDGDYILALGCTVK